MTFDDNKDSIQNVYNKMIGNLSPELYDDKYYQYFYNALETGQSYCKFNTTRLVKSIDEEWVLAIEDALGSIQRVVANPRKFIEEDRDIVNIAMARNATAESIQHLMQHSNMIDKINDDGTVIPNRILNVFKEESLNTYENRFICTLILELQKFINKRFDVIFDSSKDERGTSFEMETLINSHTEIIDYKLQIKIREKQTDVDNEKENMGIFTRISKLHRLINDLAASGFMTTMSKYPLVRHPIVKTNAIGKNLDYKACHKLWNYIHAYERIGYKIDLVNKEPIISRQFERDIYNSFLWDYFMLQNYTDDVDDIDINKPRAEKEMGIKQVRQLLDEIVRGLKMTDSDVRKLVLNELTKLQQSRKDEKQRADAIRYQKEKNSKKKGRHRTDK